MFDPDLEHQVPPADQLIFRDYARTDAWAALTEHTDHVTILREHCVLCGQYFFSGKALLEHLNHAHYEMWLESKHLAPGDELKERKKVASLLLVAMPGAPSSFLAPSSKARSP